MSEPRNLTRTLETVLGRDQGSLRGASSEALAGVLDEAQRRYGIGSTGGPSSLRDVVIARQRELVGHGLRERDVDGMIGPRTLEAERRYSRETGQRPGSLPPNLGSHPAMQNVDRGWREWVARPDRFGRTLEVLLDRDPGSLRDATPAELGTALDEAGKRYNFGGGPTPNLESAVRSVQERLHAWRSQNGEPVAVDGKVGADTEAAAAAYRAAHPPQVEPVAEVVAPVTPVVEPVDPAVEPVPPVVASGPPVVERVDPAVEPVPPVVERAEPAVEPRVAAVMPSEPVLEGPVAEPLLGGQVTGPQADPSRDTAPPPEEPNGPRTFSNDRTRELSGHLAVGAELALAEVTDELDRATSEAQLRESRELAGRLVTQWNEAALDKNAFADTLGRDLTPREIALLPEDIRARVVDRAVLREVRDLLAPALAGGSRLPSGLSEPEVLTPEGQRAGAVLERFLQQTPTAERRRIAAMLTSSVRGGFGLDEQWLLPRDVWRRLEADANYVPTTPMGAPPRPITDPRAREIAARLAANTDEARADVTQLVTRWNDDAFIRKDELADALARELMPNEIAQLPGEVRRRIEDRAMLRTLREGLQADTPPHSMGPPAADDTSQLAWNRRAAAVGLSRWLETTPSVDRQRIAYILARELTLREQWLLPRELWQQVVGLAARR